MEDESLPKKRKLTIDLDQTSSPFITVKVEEMESVNVEDDGLIIDGNVEKAALSESEGNPRSQIDPKCQSNERGKYPTLRGLLQQPMIRDIVMKEPLIKESPLKAPLIKESHENVFLHHSVDACNVLEDDFDECENEGLSQEASCSPAVAALPCRTETEPLVASIPSTKATIESSPMITSNSNFITKRRPIKRSESYDFYVDCFLCRKVITRTDVALHHSRHHGCTACGGIFTDVINHKCAVKWNVEKDYAQTFDLDYLEKSKGKLVCCVICLGWLPPSQMKDHLLSRHYCGLCQGFFYSDATRLRHGHSSGEIRNAHSRDLTPKDVATKEKIQLSNYTTILSEDVNEISKLKRISSLMPETKTADSSHRPCQDARETERKKTKADVTTEKQLSLRQIQLTTLSEEGNQISKLKSQHSETADSTYRPYQDAREAKLRRTQHCPHCPSNRFYTDKQMAAHIRYEHLCPLPSCENLIFPHKRMKHEHLNSGHKKHRKNAVPRKDLNASTPPLGETTASEDRNGDSEADPTATTSHSDAVEEELSDDKQNCSSDHARRSQDETYNITSDHAYSKQTPRSIEKRPKDVTNGIKVGSHSSTLMTTMTENVSNFEASAFRTNFFRCSKCSIAKKCNNCKERLEVFEKDYLQSAAEATRHNNINRPRKNRPTPAGRTLVDPCDDGNGRKEKTKKEKKKKGRYRCVKGKRPKFNILLNSDSKQPVGVECSVEGCNFQCSFLRYQSRIATHFTKRHCQKIPNPAADGSNDMKKSSEATSVVDPEEPDSDIDVVGIDEDDDCDLNRKDLSPVPDAISPDSPSTHNTFPGQVSKPESKFVFHDSPQPYDDDDDAEDDKPLKIDETHYFGKSKMALIGEEARDVSSESGYSSDNPSKDPLHNPPHDHQQDAPRDAPQDTPQDAPQTPLQDPPQAAPQDPPLEFLKDRPDSAMTEAQNNKVEPMSSVNVETNLAKNENLNSAVPSTRVVALKPRSPDRIVHYDDCKLRMGFPERYEFDYDTVRDLHPLERKYGSMDEKQKLVRCVLDGFEFVRCKVPKSRGKKSEEKWRCLHPDCRVTFVTSKFGCSYGIVGGSYFYATFRHKHSVILPGRLTYPNSVVKLTRIAE